MNFRIVEGAEDNLPLDEIKKDYIACELTIPELRQKYGLSSNEWYRIRDKFKKEGVPLRGLQKRADKKCYHTQMRARNYNQLPTGKWVVGKTINGKHHYYGVYDTEEEAQATVKELRKSNWGGLLND